MLFLAWWAGIFAFTFATWSGGMPDLAVSLHVATAVLAGALVAWWRFPVRDGLLIRWRPAPPSMAGAIVAIAVVSVVFIREALVATTAGEWSLAGVAEFLASWLVASVILGAIGLLCGLAGGMAAGLVGKYFKQGAGRAA